MASQFEGDPLSYPVDFTILDDGEPITTAAVVNVALEALGDRTAFLLAACVSNAANLEELILEGWDEGWPLLKPGNSVRNHTEWQHFAFTDVNTEPGSWVDGYVGADTLGSILGQAAPDAAWFPIRKLRNGAKLKTVTVYLTVTPFHVSDFVAPPSVAVYKATLGGAAGLVCPTTSPDASLYVDPATWNTPSVPPTSMTTTATTPGGELVSDAYAYFIKVLDEQGGGALGGNRYWGALIEWEISEVQP